MPIASRASWVADARWGTRTTLSSASSLDVDLGLALEDVECGAGDAAFSSACASAASSTTGAAARVHEVRRRLHQGQLALADQVMRLLGQRHVERYDVSSGQQLVQRDRVHDAHPVRLRESRDRLADATVADDAERQARAGRGRA